MGERNHRWFLAYIASNSVLLVYGAFACLSILASEVQNNGLLTATFVNKATGQQVPAGWRVVFQYLMYQHGPIMAVGLLCVVMGCVLSAFTGYHLWLLVANTTTNETFKWKDAEWHREGAMRKYERVLGEYRKLHETVSAMGGELGAGANKGAGSDSGDSEEVIKFDPPAHLVPCLEGRCEHEQHKQYSGRRVTGWVLRKPPPMPANMYDRGWRANVRECLFPPSMYGRPRDGPTEPPVAPLAQFARTGKRKGGSKQT